VKNKIEGGAGYDDNMSALGDYYHTLIRARKELTNFKKGEKITIISNATVREKASVGNNNVIVDYRYLEYEIKKTIIESTTKEDLIFDEGEYCETRDWVKEWRINDELDDILVFENDKGIQIRTGLLTLG